MPMFRSLLMFISSPKGNFVFRVEFGFADNFNPPLKYLSV